MIMMMITRHEEFLSRKYETERMPMAGFEIKPTRNKTTKLKKNHFGIQILNKELVIGILMLLQYSGRKQDIMGSCPEIRTIFFWRGEGPLQTDFAN